MSCDEDDLPPPRLKIAGYLPRLTDQEQAILEATRGLSPECIAACVAAVKHLQAQVYRDHTSGCDCLECEQCNEAVAAAIALLPKDTQ